MVRKRSIKREDLHDEEATEFLSQRVAIVCVACPDDLFRTIGLPLVHHKVAVVLKDGARGTIGRHQKVTRQQLVANAQQVLASFIRFHHLHHHVTRVP